MGKLLDRLKHILPTQRRLVQLYAALLYNAHTKGFITGEIYTGGTKVLCVPGLNCYSCPGAVGACPLGALQNAIASSRHRAPIYVLGILMLFGLTLGRTICGWLCPVGLVQELLHKIPTPKLRKNRVTRFLSYLKYVILAVFVVAIPLWYAAKSLPLPAFCKYICPAGTLEGAVGLLSHPGNADKFSMLGFLFTEKTVAALLLISLCVFVYRAFCRFFCPLGAIYGLFSRVALIGVRVEPTGCIGCGKCVSRCPMDIRHVGDGECIHCGECIAACPTEVIQFRAGKIVLPHSSVSPAQKRTRSAAWLLALLLLIGAFRFFNPPEPSSEIIVPPAETVLPDQSPDLPPIGSEVGMTAPDFTLPVTDGGTFTLSEHRGKVVVVNFWATWCTPCCEELPYFDQLDQECGDEVTVVAVHSDLVTDDIDAYLAQFDYTMPFALDETGEAAKLLGVGNMLPQTIVIDENGIITYNAVGSLNYETLLSLIR